MNSHYVNKLYTRVNLANVIHYDIESHSCEIFRTDKNKIAIHVYYIIM